jgi:thiosulfate reductase cytochrome b subunit
MEGREMKKIYIHPLPVRIWHWINAFGFVFMIVTGLQLRYPEFLALTSFKRAVELHNIMGFILIANYFIWLSFYLLSDKIKIYHTELNPKKYYEDSIRQIAYYSMGIFKGEPNPHHTDAYHKFNPMQKMAYQVIMLLVVPVQFATGLFLWDVQRFGGAIAVFGGVRVVDTVHVLCFIFFSSFLFVHFYLATLGHTPSAHFKAMFTGYEEMEEEQGH